MVHSRLHVFLSNTIELIQTHSEARIANHNFAQMVEELSIHLVGAVDYLDAISQMTEEVFGSLGLARAGGAF